MAVQAVLRHRLPSRIRLGIPEKRGDPAYFSALSEELSSVASVHHIRANPALGSIVVEFEGGLENLLAALDALGVHVDIGQPDNRALPEVTDLAPFHLVTGRDINPMFVAGSLLAVIGIVQAMRGKILVPSVTALWYAVDAFRQAVKER